MLKTKLSNKKENYFLGGYILDLKAYPERSYISISMNSFDNKKGKNEPVFIMVYKKCGFGDKKYANPLIQIITDAHEKNIPIACCYYNDGDSNKMICCYANFTAEENKNEE